ncbi:hypothetical protein AOQ84DRAFT_54925 [Glonium stellatum]|uniref:BTB domain-containing protein n=1 Tax=Glonium stellatum TaxID=574774 RepID=A0A8E2JSA8_9PEZI|nr:hypothetical protein AOQ84DRAFT_54925 [Glonium stellatum]
MTPIEAPNLNTPVRQRADISPTSINFSPSTCYDTVISAVVGKGKVKAEFCFYKELLSYHSSYFHAALNSRIAEGLSGVVHLPEDDVEVFQAFYY